MSSPGKLLNWLSSKVTAKVKEMVLSEAPKDDEVIDEAMPVLQRLVRYSESPVVAHRVAICRDLVDLGEQSSQKKELSRLFD